MIVWKLKRENFMICCSYIRSTSLATPATAWSTFSSICCQGDLPSLSAAAQLEGWEVGSVATQLEETGDVAFVFFGRKQRSSRRESRWRIFTRNSSIFFSFFAVERTWFLVKMSMEKVTTACIPSYIPPGAYCQVWCLCGWDILTDSCVFLFHILSCHIHSRWWVLTVGLYINHNSNTTPVALARYHLWDWQTSHLSLAALAVLV